MYFHLQPNGIGQILWHLAGHRGPSEYSIYSEALLLWCLDKLYSECLCLVSVMAGTFADFFVPSHHFFFFFQYL